METVFQIAEVCVEGLISTGELLCLTHLIDIIQAVLYTEEFTEADLGHLAEMIETYTSKFANLYEDVTERVQGGEKALSLQFVNLEMLWHVPMMIKQLGSMILQSSLSGEAGHLRLKNVVRRTNKKNLERDLLIKMHELEGIQNAQAEDQAVEAPKTVLEEDNDLEVEPCEPTGKSTAAVLSLGERRAVERALTQERAVIVCKSGWQDYETIHLCSHRITLGDSLLIRVPAEVHETELPSTHYCPPWVHEAFGERASTNQRPWTGLWVQLEVRAPHMVDGRYATVGPNLVLGGSAKRWIPLSSFAATRQWSLARLVSIANRSTKTGHPRTAASREFVLNLRPRWRICDEWIGGIGQRHKGRGQSSKIPQGLEDDLAHYEQEQDLSDRDDDEDNSDDNNDDDGDDNDENEDHDNSGDDYNEDQEDNQDESEQMDM